MWNAYVISISVFYKKNIVYLKFIASGFSETEFMQLKNIDLDLFYIDDVVKVVNYDKQLVSLV